MSDEPNFFTKANAFTIFYYLRNRNILEFLIAHNNN